MHLAFSAQNLTKRIFLIKNRNFIFIEKLLNVSSLSDYWTVRLLDRHTIGVSDYRSDPMELSLVPMLQSYHGSLCVALYHILIFSSKTNGQI
jgi:hypothetical protein